jgi:hypothetical protein
VRGSTTSAASVTNYNFLSVGGGVNVIFDKSKIANLSFNDGGVVCVSGNAVVIYTESDIQNISRATGSGVLVNSSSATAVELTVRQVKIANVTILRAETGGLFYLSNSSDIVLSSVQGLC